MKYKVVYLPESETENLLEIKIFSSYKEACKYIENYCCGYCRKAVKMGYYECEYKDGNQIIKDKIPVSNILDTPCGAEWIIEEIPDD